MTDTLRCGNCSHWLGESAVALVYVEHVAKGQEAKVASPRDLRLCKSCSRVNVFIALSDLGAHRAMNLDSERVKSVA